MKLYIDATNNLKTLIKTDDNEFVRESERPQDQDVLGTIMEALRLRGRTLQDVTEIEVNSGPGSFTGTRVGVSIANALGFSLGVGVNGQKPPVSPVYSEGPHITTPKDRG